MRHKPRNPGAPPECAQGAKTLTPQKQPDDYESVGRPFESGGAHHFSQVCAGPLPRPDLMGATLALLRYSFPMPAWPGGLDRVWLLSGACLALSCGGPQSPSSTVGNSSSAMQPCPTSGSGAVTSA